MVRLLGPVSAETDGLPLRLGSPLQRAVFALLALQVNNPVPLDRLVDELWRNEPPAQATLSLQSYILVCAVRSPTPSRRTCLPTSRRRAS